MDTYRFRGHSMSDPGQYRSKDEVSEMKENDPLITMKKNLIDEFKVDEKEINELELKIKKEVKEIEKYALDSPLPELKELFTEVYL